MANRNVLINENSLIAIADAIRNKTDSLDTYTVAEMADAIDAIKLSEGGTPAIGIEDTVDARGGIIRNITAVDISDTTAVASNVSKGKTFYNAKGIKTVGTSENASGWVRPADWPDLSLMDISEQVLYLTYKATEEQGFCDLKIRPAGVVEIGNIVNGNFVVETTYNVADNANIRYYFGSSSGGYKVIKITSPNKIYTFDQLPGTGVYQYNNEYRFSTNSGLLEIYGNLPNLTSLSADSSYWLESCNIKNCKPNSMASAFQYDYKLKNVDFSTWNFSNCTSMQYMFRDCSKLESVSLKGTSSKLTNLDSTFVSCYMIEEINIIDFDTTNVTTFSNMFSGCTRLKKLTIPKNFIQSKATTMASMFNNISFLDSIDLSFSNPEKMANFSSAFAGMKELKTLILPSNFVQSSATNLSNMFNGCRDLQSLDVSSWNTSNVTNISSFMQNAYWLEEFVGFENLDLGKCTNTQNMFNSTYKLESIIVPASLTTIYANTFPNTRGCYEYHFLATTPPTLANTNAFNNMNDFGGKKIYVPVGCSNAYKTATNWSTYASYIVEEGS